MAPSPNECSVLSVRLNAGERALLEAVAAQLGTSLEDFVRSKSIEAAEIEMLDRSTVVIPARHWEAFKDWISAPAQTIPALTELLRRTQSRG
jgi:uncharacterized protein (DUF1778 family)